MRATGALGASNGDQRVRTGVVDPPLRRSRLEWQVHPNTADGVGHRRVAEAAASLRRLWGEQRNEERFRLRFGEGQNGRAPPALVGRLEVLALGDELHPAAAIHRGEAELNRRLRLATPTPQHHVAGSGEARPHSSRSEMRA